MVFVLVYMEGTYMQNFIEFGEVNHCVDLMWNDPKEHIKGYHKSAQNLNTLLTLACNVWFIVCLLYYQANSLHPSTYCLLNYSIISLKSL